MIFTWRNFLPLRNMEQIEIQDVLNPIILTASLFGLIPDSVKYSGAKQTYKVIPKSIYLNILCTAVLLSLHISFLIYHIHLVFSMEENTGNISKQLNYAMELVNFLIVSCTTYIYAYVNRVKYLKIFDMIVSVWNNIPQSPNSRKIVRKLYLTSNMFLIVIIILILLQIYLNTRQPNILWKFIIGMTFNMPQVIQLCFHAFYTTLVICITAILARITELCQRFKKVTSDGESSNMNIRQMEMIYIKAFEIKMNINQMFEGPILASLFQSFHAMVSEAYLIYYAELTLSNSSKAFVIDNGLSIVCQLIKIYSLCYSGNLLKDEVCNHLLRIDFLLCKVVIYYEPFKLCTKVH